MAHDVFISYAIEDQLVADAVCQALEEGGVRCWYAPRDVPYTVDYEEAIVDAISASKLMVLILSSHSNNSAHVKREIQNACREEPQIPVLPFQVEDITLNKALKYYIGSVNWLSASTSPLETHLQKLVDYVQARLPRHKQDRDSEVPSNQPAQSNIFGADEVRNFPAEEIERRYAEGERPEGEADDAGNQHDTTRHRTVGGRTLVNIVGATLLRNRAVLLIIASIALLAALSLSFWRRTPEVGQQTTNQNETRTSSQQVDQTTGASNVEDSPPLTAPTPQPPSAMVYVPGGEFEMGRNNGDPYERPAHKVTVKPFFIDIYEVTNEEYAKFVMETDRTPPPTWPTMTYPPRAPRIPVTGVKWEDARAYANWAGKRLPTEEEWEFAARGTDGRLYPWGNKWSAGLANANGASTGMADVGASAASPFGARDMVGNAWEWTASDMKAYPGGKLPKRPASGTKVLRGGSYQSSRDQATATYRYGWRANGEASYAETGFRCVKDITNTSTAP